MKKRHSCLGQPSTAEFKWILAFTLVDKSVWVSYLSGRWRHEGHRWKAWDFTSEFGKVNRSHVQPHATPVTVARGFRGNWSITTNFVLFRMLGSTGGDPAKVASGCACSETVHFSASAMPLKLPFEIWKEFWSCFKHTWWNFTKHFWVIL